MFHGLLTSSVDPREASAVGDRVEEIGEEAARECRHGFRCCGRGEDPHPLDEIVELLVGKTADHGGELGERSPVIGPGAGPVAAVPGPLPDLQAELHLALGGRGIDEERLGSDGHSQPS